MVTIVTEHPSGSVDPDLGIGQHNWDHPQHLALGQLRMENLFRTVALEPPTVCMDLPQAVNGLDLASLEFADPMRAQCRLSAEQFLNRRLYNDALLVMRSGQVLHESYRNGMQAGDRHLIHSCTKSLCGMLVAIAEAEGRLSLQALMTDYLPELDGQGSWQGVTVQQVLDMQAGISYSEDYTDPQADYWCYARAAGYYPPLPGEEAVGVRAWVLRNLCERAHPPGTVFSYNSCLTNILGLALENIYGCGLADLMEIKLYQRVGAEAQAYFNTDHLGFPIAEGQLSLRLRDFARLAMLVSTDGRNLAGEQVLPRGFAAGIARTDPAARQAYSAGTADAVFPRGQYRHQFWVLDPDQQQLGMLGIHGQFAWFDLARELMIVGFGSYPQQDGKLMMTGLSTLWNTLADAL